MNIAACRHEHLRERSRAMQRVTVAGAVVNLILTLVKGAIGLVANSHALIADAIHSLSDLLSDGLVWFAAHHTAAGPDEEHPYGHGRFETAATLGLSAFLAVVAIGISWDAVQRIWINPQTDTPGQLALWAALLSILANEALYWYTIVIARRVNSKMLRANAWHHRSDAISSVVVFVGVGGALLGWPYLDGVAALVVGLMIGHVAWELGRSALEELVDTSLDEDAVQQAAQIIRAVDGVRSVHLLRTRRHGHEAAADVHVQVAPRLSVSEGHMIGQAVEDRLKEGIDVLTDITVHIDPEDDEQGPPCHDLPLREQVIAQLHDHWRDVVGLPPKYDLVLHYLSGRIDVDVVIDLTDMTGPPVAQELRQRLLNVLEDVPMFRRVQLLYRAR